jgi:phosphatidylinositol alpha-1,6-mannosyltransferase
MITNDFPPRQGGIEGFAKALADRLHDDDGVVVLTASMQHDGDASSVDAAVSYPVIRERANTLLPTRRLARKVVQVFKEYGCQNVVFASALPLGLLAADLRQAGAQRIIALTHGHEVTWARLPLARSRLRKVASQVDFLTAVSTYTMGYLRRALPEVDRKKLTLLTP